MNVEVLHKWHSSLDPKKIVFLFCLAEVLTCLNLIWGFPKNFEVSSKLFFEEDLVINAFVILKGFFASKFIFSFSLTFKAVFSFDSNGLMLVSYSGKTKIRNAKVNVTFILNQMYNLSEGRVLCTTLFCYGSGGCGSSGLVLDWRVK